MEGSVEDGDFSGWSGESDGYATDDTAVILSQEERDAGGIEEEGSYQNNEVCSIAFVVVFLVLLPLLCWRC